MSRNNASQQQLQVLLQELSQIEAQQARLRAAAAEGRPISVRPREAVSSGGLWKASIARDLLSLDFVELDEASDRFQEQQAGRSVYGVIQPGSPELQTYIARLEEQQRAILSAVPGLRRQQGQEEPHSMASTSTAVPSASRVAPPTGAALAETGVASDAAAAAAARPTAAATGAAPAQSAQPAKRVVRDPWKQPAVIDLKFGAKNKAKAVQARAGHVSPWGVLLVALYVASFAAYMLARIAKTISTHDRVFPYEVVFIVAEFLVFFSGLFFGLCQLCVLNQPAAVLQARSAQKAVGTKSESVVQGPLLHKYHIQVLVYSPGHNLARTEQVLMAAHTMVMPEGPTGPACTRIVYLIDPIRDPEKMALVNKMSVDGIVYMPGPEDITLKTDLGKAATLNRVLRKLYPREVAVKPSELVAVFNDDQVPHPFFVQRTIRELEERNVRLVHTRPGYENVPKGGDLFNQHNHHLYRSQTPGYEALGAVSCAGTNFLVRADALQSCDWFPAYSLAEAHALGEELALKGFLSYYHDEVLATGLAPVRLSRVYAAKRQEATGYYQMFYRTRPAYAGHLTHTLKAVYNCQAWTNQTCAIVTPIFVLVPIMRILFNVFPFHPNRYFGLGFLLYYCIATPLLYKSYSFWHARGLWFLSTAQQNLWLSYFCKMITSYVSNFTRETVMAEPIGRDLPKKKVIEDPMGKGTAVDTESGLRIGAVNPAADAAAAQAAADRRAAAARFSLSDLPWTATFMWAICTAGWAIGLWLLVGTHGAAAGSPGHLTKVDIANNLTLVVSILWLFYHSVLFFVPIFWAAVYTTTRSRAALTGFSYAAWFLAWAAAVLVAVACIGLGRADIKGFREYGGTLDANYTQALSSSVYFYEAQRSGALSPAGTVNYVAWRGDSGLADMPVGGWYEGGSNLKLTFPIAIAVQQLAWSLITSPDVYDKAGLTLRARDNLAWGADYLVACRQAVAGGFITQVGSFDTETSTWTRPEDMNATVRPTYGITDSGADVVGASAAALAAVAIALKTANYGVSSEALASAQDLYAFAKTVPGIYTNAYADAGRSYYSQSYQDDLATAAAWLYMATGNITFLHESQAYYAALQQDSIANVDNPVANWDNQYWTANLLLLQATGLSKYEDEMQRFKGMWREGSVNGSDLGVIQDSQGLAYALSAAATGTDNSAVGSLRNAANAAFLMAVYGQRLSQQGQYYQARESQCWAHSQLRYMLGSGTGRSYVVGVGSPYPGYAQHRGASCPSNLNSVCAGPIASSPAYLSANTNPNVLLGALVSGPARPSVASAGSYQDSRQDSDNAISVEYNSAFQGAAAILAQHSWEVCQARNGILDEEGVHIGNGF